MVCACIILLHRASLRPFGLWPNFHSDDVWTRTNCTMQIFQALHFLHYLKTESIRKMKVLRTIPLITEQLFKNGKVPHWIWQMNVKNLSVVRAKVTYDMRPSHFVRYNMLLQFITVKVITNFLIWYSPDNVILACLSSSNKIVTFRMKIFGFFLKN